MRFFVRGIRSLRESGIAATCRMVVDRILPSFRVKRTRSGEALPHRFAFEPDEYRYVSAETISNSAERLNWVIPDFYGGSGGHTTIFRMTQALERRGYEIHFHIFGQTHFLSEAEATNAMRELYFPLKATVHLGVTEMEPSEVCLASSWETAYAVRDFNACRRKIYFVQDFEPMFFAASTESALAEETYRFGFECICCGQWLAQKMREFGSKARAFDLAYDPDIYFPEPVPRDQKRVLFYARHGTPRRGTVLGLMALALLKRKCPDAEIVLFGSDDLPYELPFDYISAGILSESALAQYYRSATVGLSISLTNYSLVLQEMLACGLPVVEMDLPSVRAAYPASSPGLKLAAQTPSAIAAALAEFLTMPDSEMKKARIDASSMVRHLSWSDADQTLVDLLQQA